MDANLLLSEVRKSREIPVTVGRFKFILERPTEMEVIRMRKGGHYEIGLDLIQDKCKGWDGVLESDIVRGGASDPQPFSKLLYMDWIADRRDLWAPMMEAFSKAIDAHDKQLDALAGN